MKRTFCALLTALTVLLGALPAASGAEAPSVLYRGGSGGVSLQAVGVTGGVYGAQLTVTVPGSCPRPVFTPASREVYSPGCTVEERSGSTTVTLYLTADAPMNSGSTLPLGTLDLGGASLPAVGELTLLNRSLAASTDTVPLLPLSPGDAGNSGNSGSSGDRPSRPSRPGGGKDDKTDAGGRDDTPPATPDYASVEPPFLDTPRSEWYYGAVQYVYARGMMSGTAGDAFSPAAPTTRGMIVTILHRLEGSPAAGAPSFLDVDGSLYYAAPIAWASANGLVNGYDTGGFGPEDPITRQQLTAILYRYAVSKGCDTGLRGDLSGFKDAAAVNDYAVEPLRWAIGAGLISGMDDGTVSPAGRATRAQVATILMRFCENVAGENR